MDFSNISLKGAFFAGFISATIGLVITAAGYYLGFGAAGVALGGLTFVGGTAVGAFSGSA